MARLQHYLCLDDFERAARRRLPRPLFGYISGASETNASLRYNAEGFDAYAFRPRVLRDVSGRSTRTTLFGETYDAPFGIAPMGISALMAYRGDIALATAARTCCIPMIMSGSSLIPMEEVAAAAPGSWFQVYLPGEPGRIDALLDRVQRTGFRTLVITVDTAALANRENNIRAGFSTPLRPSLGSAWQSILHPGDASRAQECGADGLIVSNHGGCQVDGTMCPKAKSAQSPSDAATSIISGHGVVPFNAMGEYCWHTFQRRGRKIFLRAQKLGLTHD